MLSAPETKLSVSVVIPAYRASAVIRTALNSVLTQTLPAHEIIVVNDGSPDSGWLEQALAPYSTCIRYFSRPHRGPSAARNFGIMEARSQYVAFLDSDDYWLPDHLATQMAMFRADPALGLVYGDSFLVKGGQVIGRTFERESQVLPVTFDALMEESCTATTSTTVGLRSALLEAGLFDERLSRCEDFDLWLRMAFRGTRMTHHSTATACRTLSSSGLSADGCLMKRARIAVLEKIRSCLSLTADQHQRLSRRLKFTSAMVQLDQFKQYIREGAFDKALDSGRIATSALPGWKLRAAVSCVEHAPQALRFYYRAHELALAFRNRSRAAKASRALSTPLHVTIGDPRFADSQGRARKPMADGGFSASAAGRH